MAALRGADILARALARAGVKHLFTLSGNQIMPVYDATHEAGQVIHHVRHEGAAVHMADAWARMTNEVGVALVTGGPGHANAVGALYTALASESPMVLLSGHAPLKELHMGAFQEMRQADMAAPVVKAAFTAQSAATLGQDIARAMRHARFGRPGPVHLSLPFDVLEERVADGESAIPASEAFAVKPVSPGDVVAKTVLEELARAKRPLILTGPAMSTDRGRHAQRSLSAACGVPVICMESPRGVNDPCLGAFPTMLAQADLIVLLGKQLDFTLKFGQAPAIAKDARFIVLDPDPEALRRAGHALGDPTRIALAMLAEPYACAQRLASLASRRIAGGWSNEVEAALKHRPAAWAQIASAAGAPAHPVEVGRAVQALIDTSKDAVLVSDGGEFGQWAQACVSAPTRIINGPAGAIGSALPFALAAKLARPAATVIAMLGDGTFGFHAMEFDTAVRESLPLVAVIGNDACWNAEHQIQLRTYGRERAVGCTLLPTRYDQMVAALGGHGEFSPGAADLPAGLARAAASGLPACVNAMIEGLPAPAVHP